MKEGVLGKLREKGDDQNKGTYVYDKINRMYMSAGLEYMIECMRRHNES